ncbi:LysR family transcriptional regulator [Rhizobium anhuiense]|jgi:DNA-binding transcriptional LysR family regulator|uniref:HTH-type transcriptional regulator TtuA n=1 Tax=Rhizobium anhuiense TaxID=1184720 RepID=A0A3S0SQR6_9HYPH|nr:MULTISPECIES: LysR family transcriptional regulator [Rhizobium]KZS49819.1 LysR family transcriptional regulator [Rhizobium anhuiense bv. trifolii]MBB3298123.1 DNA-binding transcriptional LysR family regulator [Rhizobium sp. BK112]MBB3366572.1 DNA-binding transcriptional LysR family regulator [Rhizobium sp. BK077]MBB4116646.1 DNA-binding transcriptional LysR family regulator [Rhizobium sp. BK226]MBB4177383.1 DNA-binding transcriptional LysR family regulator [Rhizobium sp. BK109]
MDRLTSLTVFGRVVECGGFSAAARRLNMSVTMVGNHVQSLEDRLGVRLLNRTTRKVSLTETGKYYYERSSQILAELEEADRTAGALSSTPRGTLRVYTSSAIVRFLLPVVSEYMELYPSISLDFSVGERMVDMIEDGYDLVMRTVPPPDSSLVARKLTPWRHMLVCSPAYFESHPMPKKPAEVAEHNCLQYAYYPYGDEWRFEDGAGNPESVKIAGNVVSNSAEMLRFLTLSGRGIFLAPSFVVFDDIAEGRLVKIMPDYRPVEFNINAVYPNRSHLPTKVRLFIDLLVERFAEHRKWMT